MNRHERRKTQSLAVDTREHKGRGKHDGNKKGYHKGSFGSAPEHGNYPPYKMRKSKQAKETARLASGGVPRHTGGKN
jgi:hypothetical protein